MKYITKTALKKELKERDKVELMELIIELHGNHLDVKKALTILYGGESVENELYEKTRGNLKQELCPTNGLPSLSLKESTKQIDDFINVSKNKKLQIDLMVDLVLYGMNTINMYIDLSNSYYNGVVKMFKRIMLMCTDDRELFDYCKPRLQQAIDKAGIKVMGFDCVLSDYYYDYAPYIDEDDELEFIDEAN